MKTCLLIALIDTGESKKLPQTQFNKIHHDACKTSHFSQLLKKLDILQYVSQSHPSIPP